MKLGFIGAGNMASAIIGGLLAKQFIAEQDLYISDPNAAQLAKFSCNTSQSNEVTVASSDVVVLAVKPAYVKTALQGLDFTGKVLISIAAGVDLATLEAASNAEKIIRVMPNTPALVGEAMCVLCANSAVEQQDTDYARALFSAVGQTMELPERLFDAVTAVSGSGPAYVFMMIEALADGGVAEGLPRQDAYTLAAQTLLGSAKMVLETKKHPGELKDMVCSPAGTTIEAVQALERGGFRAALMDCVKVCAQKSKALGK